MPYCTNCGAQYDDGAKFCPTCGATTGETAQQSTYTNPTQPVQQPVQTDNSKTMAILAVVFPILFFLPIVTNPKTEFGTFWANQALLLLLLSVVASITAGIVIGILIWVFQVVLWIMALVSVCKGETSYRPTQNEPKNTSANKSARIRNRIPVPCVFFMPYHPLSFDINNVYQPPALVKRQWQKSARCVRHCGILSHPTHFAAPVTCT